MSEKRFKEMPTGAWLYFKGLPPSTTDETLAAYFQERGLAIRPECISVKVFDDDVYRTPTAGAMVSVSHEVTLLMVEWVLNGDPIEGKIPRPELARCSKR